MQKSTSWAGVMSSSEKIKPVALAVIKLYWHQAGRQAGRQVGS